MSDTVRWGIAGPGGIAKGFADGMRLVDDGVITAVASRSQERADAFAAEFGIPTAYGDYRALADDPEIDVVYVATVASQHEANTLLFLEAGKHVLCEKPFALSAQQARRMAGAARDRGLFLMEAMWSRFLPAYRELQRVLDEGRIGEVLQVEADFGFRWPFDPEHRHFDLGTGGGGLLDLGIYPVQLCTLVLGLPERVAAFGHVGETGVDEQVAAVLDHGEGRLGVIKTALRVNLACTARISGTDGWVDLPAFMHCPDWLSVNGPDGSERIDAAYEGNGLRFQVPEVHRCLGEGLTESPVMSLGETIAIAGILDDIRGQIGLVYPGE
jgi:predicted dehydrogenase